MAQDQIALVETAQPLWQRKISAAWSAYQKTEHHGLELGRVLCEARDNLRSKGGFGTKGKGLTGYLQVLGIPRGTSDYWMDGYENSIGVKPPDEWSRDKEKRANRSEFVEDFEELRTLAIKMLNASYKAFRATGNYDNSHLHAAKEWARLTLEGAE